MIYEGAIVFTGDLTDEEATALVNTRLNEYSDRYADHGIIIEPQRNYVTGCQRTDEEVIVSYTVSYQGQGVDLDLDILLMDGEGDE